MSKEDIFEELLSIRIFIEESPSFCSLDPPNVDMPFALVVDKLQELIWKVGEDIGEF